MGSTDSHIAKTTGSLEGCHGEQDVVRPRESYSAAANKDRQNTGEGQTTGCLLPAHRNEPGHYYGFNSLSIVGINSETVG